jgi:hypothetical protein
VLPGRIGDWSSTLRRILLAVVIVKEKWVVGMLNR